MPPKNGPDCSSPEASCGTPRPETCCAELPANRQAALYEALVAATAEIVWHHDVLSGRSVRQGWLAFTGVEDDPADPLCWLRCVHEADRERAEAAALDAARTGVPLTMQYRLRHRGGGWRWVEDHAVPVYAGRTLTDWVGIVTDIHARRVAEDDLRESETRFRMAVEATGLGTYDVDLRTGERRWSAELKAMLGLPADRPEDAALLWDSIHDEDRATLERFYADLVEHPDVLNQAVFRCRRWDNGRTAWIWAKGRIVRDEAGIPVRRIGTFQDITEQQETREALSLAIRRQEALIAATSEIVWQASADQTEGGGTGWTEFTGQDLDEAAGEGWLASVHPEDRERARRTCAQAVAAGVPYTNEYRLRHRGGEWRWVIDRVVPLKDAAGAVTEWVGIISDVHNRRTAEERIRRAALTDPLTGLVNRAGFQLRLDAMLEADAGDRMTALFLVDLDRFKEVNDSLGHDAGDHALRVLAAQLAEAVPEGATVGRLGGDEFGVLVAVEGEREARQIASALMIGASRPVLYGSRDLDCSVTIGYAVHPLHDADPSALLKNADMALYAAKEAGRGRALAFARSMRAEFDRRLNVMRTAREALAEHRIVPFYQPKMSLADGRTVGFEALLRWWDGRRLQGPDALREAFQDRDLSTRIGARMRDLVCADMAAWRDAGVEFGHVAINVAAPEIHEPAFVPDLLEALRRHRLGTESVEIEVTEGVLVDGGAGPVARTLRALDGAGIAIALDDFGTGFASLTHLKRYPVSFIKIDRSFVSGLAEDPDSAAIIHAVLGMARNLGIRVVAEGVETAPQREYLHRNGCDLIQGFLVAKPMAASRVPGYLLRAAGKQPSRYLATG